jgi:Fe-S-cluster containining protein
MRENSEGELDMSGSALFEVDLDTPLGHIRGKVAVETGPMRLAELVPSALELTNILAGRAVRREEKSGRKVTCGSGCGACCRQMVPVSPPEAFYIADMLDSFDHGSRAEVLGRFDEILRELQRRHMIDELMDPQYSDDPPVLPIAKQYFNLQRPCPFLREESCTIHPNRPVACREYNVTSPASWCADPYSHEVAKVLMPLPLSAPLAQLTAHLTDSKPRLIPLTLVPYWVSQNIELRERQWPGLELFQQFMAKVGKSPSQNSRSAVGKI